MLQRRVQSALSIENENNRHLSYAIYFSHIKLCVDAKRTAHRLDKNITNIGAYLEKLMIVCFYIQYVR
jgi:hypothetical protein